MSSVKEDHRSGEVDSSEEAGGAFVVAGGKNAVLLEFGEEVFNQRPDLMRHPEVEEPGAWIPAFAGMTGGYTASLFALDRKFTA